MEDELILGAAIVVPFGICKRILAGKMKTTPATAYRLVNTNL